MSELQKAVAFVFKRKGHRTLPAMEFKHAVSLDLRWYAPADAKRFLQAAVHRGFVREEGETVTLTFDPNSVPVPLQLRPTLEVIDEAGPVFVPPAPAAAPAKDPAQALATELAAALGADSDLLLESARQESERAAGLLTAEVALLVAARRRGLDVRPFAARAAAAPRS